MFVVDEATAAAIQRAYHEGGELSGIVELRRHFPLITDNANAALRPQHRELGISIRCRGVMRGLGRA